MKEIAPLILVVDDDRTTLMMLETRLLQQGYQVITATNAKSAKEIITEHHKKLDAVLLDRMMPNMDGIEVVKWINSNKEILKPPIIMQTGADAPQQVKEGIDSGVFYYLTKPVGEDVLKSVVSLAVKESKQYKVLNDEIARHRTSFKLIGKALFKIHTLDEAEDVACFVANCFPDPCKILPGIAALVVNAVEYGICRISYDEKTKFIAEDTWKQEVERRLRLEENKNKFIELLFSREGNKHTIKVSDQGGGFAWQKFINVDQSRALDNHGRGIARASMLFDSLEYNNQGNQVTAIVDKTQQENFKW